MFKTDEDEETQVLVRKKTEQRGGFTRVVGRLSERRKAEKQMMFIVRRAAQRENVGQM